MPSNSSGQFDRALCSNDSLGYVVLDPRYVSGVLVHWTLAVLAIPTNAFVAYAALQVQIFYANIKLLLVASFVFSALMGVDILGKSSYQLFVGMFSDPCHLNVSFN